jgi:hypothetical protein
MGIFPFPTCYDGGIDLGPATCDWGIHVLALADGVRTPVHIGGKRGKWLSAPSNAPEKNAMKVGVRGNDSTPEKLPPWISWLVRKMTCLGKPVTKINYMAPIYSSLLKMLSEIYK